MKKIKYVNCSGVLLNTVTQEVIVSLDFSRPSDMIPSEVENISIERQTISSVIMSRETAVALHDALGQTLFPVEKE